MPEAAQPIAGRGRLSATSTCGEAAGGSYDGNEGCGSRVGRFEPEKRGLEMTDAQQFASGDAGTMAADSESLILVDEADREVGHMSKAQCHQGRGTLHRAFSLLIFNGSGELLIQQRAASKRLWPLFWSNSCCSHPRCAESMESAIHRRLREELGLHCPLHFLYKFQYHAQFDAGAAEHELCSVFIGRCTDPVRADRNEVLDWRWAPPEALQAELSGSNADKFTPWFKMEWKRVWREHRAALLALQ